MKVVRQNEVYPILHQGCCITHGLPVIEAAKTPFCSDASSPVIRMPSMKRQLERIPLKKLRIGRISSRKR